MKYPLFTIIIYIMAGCNQGHTGKQQFEKGVFSADSSGNKLYTTDLEDTQMNNAISRARADLPLFDKALKSGNRNYNYFAIKKRYRTPDGGGEHIWIARVSAVKQGYTGLVNNDPVNTDEIKYGDTVYVLKDDITDWMYLDSNLLRGGYTMRVELKRMKPDEKAAFLKELDYKIEE